MNLVVDASVAVEYLLRTEIGLHAASVMDGAALFAPELLDVEVLAVLRRHVLGGRLGEERAAEAVEDLAAWDLDRIRHRDLAQAAWSHRHNATAYDSFYLAAAGRMGAAILTVDGPLARIPIAGVVIQNLSIR